MCRLKKVADRTHKILPTQSKANYSQHDITVLAHFSGPFFHLPGLGMLISGTPPPCFHQCEAAILSLYKFNVQNRAEVRKRCCRTCSRQLEGLVKGQEQKNLRLDYRSLKGPTTAEGPLIRHRPDLDTFSGSLRCRRNVNHRVSVRIYPRSKLLEKGLVSIKLGCTTT